ncbi:hypothetical protein Ade02nite_18470 [Paractinoplanes deccanensis]|uniref:Lipoprotein n=1 Tax=Paractinoplanes deccanensis TaxID=113561 RepID=A0ABQ3XZN3_9ACTN|nr:hypothetical protein [Actinoplanes deccanensis]GID73206.1 hypothetical protein Ade02nite_18470 [Actinoplanes deccanensis]
MARLRSTGIAVTVAAAAAMAGCAAEAQPATLSPAALDLAVRSAPYQQEQVLLARAERTLTRECMAAKGYSYTETGTGTVLDDPWRPDLEGRRLRGYGLAKGDPPVNGPKKTPPGYLRALTGDENRRATLSLSSGPRFTFATTGCLAESRARLYGDVTDAARAAYVPQEAYNALLPSIVGDPQTREAVQRWSRCMRGRGHSYASASEARAAAAGAYRAERPGAEAHRFEIRVAVADGECALAAGFPGLIDRVGRLHAGRLTARQREDLNTAAELRAAGLRQARRIIER